MHIFPLNHARLPPGLPNLRHAIEARIARFQESPIDEDSRISSAIPQAEKGKRRDWLPLLLREALSTFCRTLSSLLYWLTETNTVSLKYLTSTQCLDLTYEGRRRRFKLASVSSETHSPEEDLTQDLNNLSLDGTTKLWVVSWDTVVVILDDRNSRSINHHHDAEVRSYFLCSIVA